MTVWHSIDDRPDRPMPVLIFFGNARSRDGIGWKPTADLVEPYREERCEVGYWDGEDWRENGTAHSLFEECREPYWFPTHWMALPEPPTEGTTWPHCAAGRSPE